VNYVEPGFNTQFGIPPADWVKAEGGFTFSSDPFYKKFADSSQGL
jgi:hypothetical protein